MNKSAALFSTYAQKDFKDFSKIIDILKENDFSVNFIKIDYEKIEETIQIVKDYARTADYLIGDELSSFFLRYETNSNARILINPVMKPSTTKNNVQINLLEKIRRMKTYIDDYRDAEMRFVNYAIFENQNSLDAKLFIEQYGRKFDHKYNNYCFDNRIEGLKKALEYYEHADKRISKGLEELGKQKEEPPLIIF